jgi:quercetin dioxygenase-like cupin family protein
MIRTQFVLNLVVLALSLTVLPIGTWGEVQAQGSGTTGHEHVTEVACVDIPPGQKRAEFGCFNIGTVKELHFSQPAVYWHLYAFGSRKAADAAKSATGLVVEEDGRVWLSEFGARDSASRGGEAVAVIGPMQLPVAKSYSAVLSYAVMRPGDSSRVHTHPGPEGWYVIAGEQCLETPAGASKAGAGQTMTVPPNVPMELNVTGTTLRRAFALVIHDATQQRGIPSDWKPSKKCDP